MNKSILKEYNPYVESLVVCNVSNIDFENDLNELHLIYRKIKNSNDYVIFNMRLQDAKWLFDRYSVESFFYADRKNQNKNLYFQYIEKNNKSFCNLTFTDFNGIKDSLKEYLKVPINIFERNVKEGLKYIESLISYKADDKLFEKIRQTVHETVLTKNSSIHRAFLYESEEKYHERMKRIGKE